MTITPDLMATCWTTAGTALPLPGQSRSSLPLAERIATAARGGWRGFGLVHADLETYLTTGSLKDLRRLFNDHGIEHIELELIEHWWATDERRPGSDVVRRDLFTAAEALGAQTIKIGPETTPQPVDPDEFAASFAALATEAAAHGTRVALEFLPFATHGNSLAMGIDLVTRVAHPAGGLCLDIWHVARPGADYAMIATALPVEYIFSVELNDAAPTPVGTLFEDTIHRRLLPGQGDFDVPAFINAVRATGFDGPWGVEILSDHHRTLPLAEGLTQARDATLACFAEADRRVSD